MADTDEDFGKQLADAFEADMAEHGQPVLPTDPEAPEVTPPAANAEEPKKDDPAKPADPTKEEPVVTPADPAKPTEEDPANPQDPEAPVEPETPKPLTEEGVRKLLNEARTEERTSIQSLDNATKEVMDAYYPEGLSNILIDQSSGKELRTPQDVVDASNGEMTMESAAQWLMNEQYKLDQNITKIKADAGRIAENTVSFKRDSMAVLEKYEPLFKAYPQLQKKAYDLMMKQTKIDEEKSVVLQAPDVMDLYDTYLEPYQQAYEYSTKQSATNPVTPPVDPAAPVVQATPGAEDRLDENGDGGISDVDDPNDFAQQVNKELAKGF